MKVSHKKQMPRLLLPSHDVYPQIPSGWQAVTVESRTLHFNFTDTEAIEVAEEPAETNMLPNLLR